MPASDSVRNRSQLTVHSRVRGQRLRVLLTAAVAVALPDVSASARLQDPPVELRHPPVNAHDERPLLQPIGLAAEARPQPRGALRSEGADAGVHHPRVASHQTAGSGRAEEEEEKHDVDGIAQPHWDDVNSMLLFDDVDSPFDGAGPIDAVQLSTNATDACDFEPIYDSGIAFSYAARRDGDWLSESITSSSGLLLSVGRLLDVEAPSLLQLSRVAAPGAESRIACLAVLGELEDVVFGAAALLSMMDRETCTVSFGSFVYEASASTSRDVQAIKVSASQEEYGKELIEIATRRGDSRLLPEAAVGAMDSCGDIVRLAVRILMSSMEVDSLPRRRHRSKAAITALLYEDQSLAKSARSNLTGDDLDYFSRHVKELLSAPGFLFDALGVLAAEVQESLLRPPPVAPAALLQASAGHAASTSRRPAA